MSTIVPVVSGEESCLVADRRSETKGRSPLLHDLFWDYDKVGGASPVGARGMTGQAAQRR